MFIMCHLLDFNRLRSQRAYSFKLRWRAAESFFGANYSNCQNSDFSFWFMVNISVVIGPVNMKPKLEQRLMSFLSTHKDFSNDVQY